MANRILKRIMHGPKGQPAEAPDGMRYQLVQRLQVGISGVVLMILLVALADVIRERADETDAVVASEVVATVAAEESPKPTDPMVDAGVVPDLPTNPDEIPAQDKPVLPEVGTGAAQQAPREKHLETP